jgi:hypothetical protein
MQLMSEQEYRALPIDSYSSLKLFIENRLAYYKKFILNEVIKEEKTEALTMGNLIDCLRLTPEQFDNKFAMAITQVPSGQYLKFVDELMKQTLYALNRETGEVTREMEAMMLDAYNACKFDRDGNIVDFKRDSFEVVKRKFIGGDLQAYYNQLRNSYGKEVVDLSQVENARIAVNTLSENFVTRDIMNLQNSEYIRVFNQFAIIGELNSEFTGSTPYPLKCLVDKLVINAETKMIYIYDLKTCWDNEQEFLKNYLKYKYYIQAAVYYYLVVEWKKKQRGLESYTVDYPKFIVAETTNYKNPLIYNITQENLLQGMRGFTINSKYYPGVIKAVTDLIWHKENAIWNISKDNYVNNGVVNIPVFK